MRGSAFAAAVLVLLGAAGCASGPLVAAAGGGDLNRVTELLDHGADIEKLDGGTDPCATPLMNAARNGQDAVIKELLKHGANIDKAWASGNWNAVICAARGHQENTLRLLLDAGAKVTGQNVELIRAQQGPMFNSDQEKRIDAMLQEASDRQRSEERQNASTRARATHNAPAHHSTQPASASPKATAPVISDIDSPSEHAAPREDDFALVIGIEKYSRLPEARYAENDADAMKRHLLALGYPERNIILLKGGQATRGALQGYVEEWLPKNAKPDSKVFVYFSGHGSPDPKTGDAYLVPWDGDAMFLKSTAYPLKPLVQDEAHRQNREQTPLMLGDDATF